MKPSKPKKSKTFKYCKFETSEHPLFGTMFECWYQFTEEAGKAIDEFWKAERREAEKEAHEAK